MCDIGENHVRYNVIIVIVHSSIYTYVYAFICTVAAETEDEERWKKIAKDVQEAISAVLGNTDSDENNDNLISSDDTVDR